jgi:hypothetical protein
VLNEQKVGKNGAMHWRLKFETTAWAATSNNQSEFVQPKMM